MIFYVKYDDNGNLVVDRNKSINSITYNHLNLPQNVAVNNSPDVGSISNTYDATGIKQRRSVLENGVSTLTDYAGNYIYENDILKQFAHPEGYVQYIGNQNYSYVYNIKDHLGNVRLNYSDIDNDGLVNQSEILKEKNYYPFGMVQKGYNGNIQGILSNLKEYQGQELDKSLNLDWHHFKYRTYDAAIGRFLQIDPLAPTYVYNSTFAFAENNAISGTDLEGLELSFQLNGFRATAVNGPTVNTYTLQEVKSIILKKKSEYDAFMNKVNKSTVSTRSEGNIGYPASSIQRQLYNKSSGFLLAQSFYIGAQEAATDFFTGGFGFRGVNLFRKPASKWDITNHWRRGRKIEKRLRANGDWPSNFPGIDKIVNGKAISIKSINVTLPTYTKKGGLLGEIKKHINKLDEFKGAARTNRKTGQFFDIQSGRDFTSKGYELAIDPSKLSLKQWEQLGKAAKYANDKNISFSVKFIF